MKKYIDEPVSGMGGKRRKVDSGEKEGLDLDEKEGLVLDEKEGPVLDEKEGLHLDEKNMKTIREDILEVMTKWEKFIISILEEAFDILKTKNMNVHIVRNHANVWMKNLIN